MVAFKSEAKAREPQRKALGAGVHSQRERQRIAAEESQRLQQVLQHPVFLKDPIAAVTNHLNNTLPSPAAAKSTKAAKQPSGQRKASKSAMMS